MKRVIGGLLAVLVVAGLMWLGWDQYRDFLTQGMKPTEGMALLNRMTQEGVPDFELVDIKGENLSLSQYQDRIILLNFWASWCEPCIAEFPSMMRLLRRYPEEMVLVAISADHSEEEMFNFLRVFGADEPNLRVAWDQEMKVARLYGTQVLPESYIIGPGLRLIRKVAGVEDWDTPGAQEYFAQVVARELNPDLDLEN